MMKTITTIKPIEINGRDLRVDDIYQLEVHSHWNNYSDKVVLVFTDPNDGKIIKLTVLATELEKAIRNAIR